MFETYIDLYDCQIVSCVGDSSAGILNRVESALGYDECDMDFRGYTDVHISPDYTLMVLMFFVRENISPGLISHECLHAVNFITEHLLIKDEEASAYLLDWLVNKQHLHFQKDLLTWYTKNKA